MKESVLGESMIPRRVIETSVNILRHDLKKPEATVRMFLDILDQIVSKPMEVELWKKNILTSFDRVDKRFEELRVLTQTTPENLISIPWQEIVGATNQRARKPMFRVTGNLNSLVCGEKKLLELFFQKLGELLNVEIESEKEFFYPSLYEIKNTAYPGQVVLAINSGGIFPNMSREEGNPQYLLACILCQHILKIHAGNLEEVSREKQTFQIRLNSAPSVLKKMD